MFEFKAWRCRLGLSQQEAADALGLSKGTIENYEAGRRRGSGQTVDIPKHIEAACNWISLQRAAERNHAIYATREARLLARQLMYSLSLPVYFSQTSSPGREFPTGHALAQYLGDIPKDETSLLEMLFPYADPKDLRRTMFRTWNPQDGASPEVPPEQS